MLEKSEVGLYGVVGGMTVIVMLAYTMWLVAEELLRRNFHHGADPIVSKDNKWQGC